MKSKKARLSSVNFDKPVAAILTLRKLIHHLPRLINKQLMAVDELHKKFGDYLIIKPKGFDEIVLTCNPGVINHVLKENEENYHRMEMMEALAPFLGEGLFYSEGAKWESQRSMMKPAFVETQLRSFEAAIVDETEKFIGELEAAAKSNAAFNIDDASNIFLFRIIEKTMLHKNSKLNHKKINYRLQILLHEASLQQQVVKHIKKSLLKPFGIKYDFRKSIRAQLPELEEAAKYLIELSMNDPDNAGIMMKILLSAFEEKHIDISTIRDTIMTFFFAAFDTTGEGFKWCLYCMAKHKNDVARMREELNNKSINGDVLKIPSLKNFINEVLRLYPPVWGAPRLAMNEDNADGIRIPKGTNIYLNFFSLHRSEKYWSEPEKFFPHRFENEKTAEMMKYYLPFGLGKHTCIGKRFALLQMSAALAMIIPKFNFELTANEEPVLIPGVLLESKKPIYLKVKKID